MRHGRDLAADGAEAREKKGLWCGRRNDACGEMKVVWTPSQVALVARTSCRMGPRAAVGAEESDGTVRPVAYDASVYLFTNRQISLLPRFFFLKKHIQLFVWTPAMDALRPGLKHHQLAAGPVLAVLCRTAMPSATAFFSRPLKLFQKTVEAFFVNGSSFRGCVVAGPQNSSPSIEAP